MVRVFIIQGVKSLMWEKAGDHLRHYIASDGMTDACGVSLPTFSAEGWLQNCLPMLTMFPTPLKAFSVTIYQRELL